MFWLTRLALLSPGLLLTRVNGVPAQIPPDSAAARGPTLLCARAQPKPACSAFVLTNLGGYLVLGQPETGPLYGLGPFRGVADWGVMVNIGPRDAAGASVFASVEQPGFVLGPAVRYRRWLSESSSFEVAAGTPVTSTTYDVRPGSVFGLVRWSPNRWVGVAARPEIVRRILNQPCGSMLCTVEGPRRGRVSIGVEIGGPGGFALTTATGVATLVGVALLALASSHT